MDSTRLDDALEAIAQAQTSVDLKHSMQQVRDSYGLAHLVYVGLRMPDLVESDPYLVFTYPQEWVERYRRENLFRIDPIITASKSGFLPIDWSTIEQSPEARYVFTEAARYGIGKIGMSFPIRGPDGDASVFSFTMNLAGGEWAEFKKEHQTEIAFIGMYFHERAIRIWAGERGIKVRPTLTVRERECLQLLAEGDPPKKIATTLTLSEAAVRLYLKRARARLGATTLMQAVIIALRANLIEVP